MESCQALASALQDLVHQHGRGRAGVQRRGTSAQRQCDQRIAGFRDPRTHPCALGAHHEDDARRCSRARRTTSWLPRRRRSTRRPRPSPAPGSRPCCARARSRRCSTAPADAFATAGVTAAARRSHSTSPLAPAHSALRAIAPRFCGSCSSSSATMNGSLARQQLLGGDVRIAAGLGADALVVGRAAAALDLLARSRSAPAASRSQGSRAAARSVAQTWSICRRPARSASRTGLRP